MPEPVRERARPRAADRLPGIDALRFALCGAVSVLHALPYRPLPPRASPAIAALPDGTWASYVAMAARGAVPFYFVASGYFMTRPATARAVLRPLARLAPAYVFWLLIYLAASYAFRRDPMDYPLGRLLRGGPGYHLWFLPVLAATLVVLPLCLRAIGIRITALGAALIALYGLLTGAYAGVTQWPPTVWNNATIAPALVLTGHAIGRSGLVPRPGPALAAAALCGGLTLGEEHLIAQLSQAAFTSHATVASTFGLGPALFLLARSLGSSRAVDLCARLGPISLGIYASHVLWLWLLTGWFDNHAAAAALAIGLAAFALATLTSAALDRWGWTRRFVR